MLRTMFHAKIHRATVTQADLHYVGSVTVDQDLLDAADILPGELVSIVDVTNGARLETYTIAGERGSGVLGINGAAAHLVHPGDIVILIAYGQMDDDEARNFQSKVVHVDADNRIVELGIDPADGLLARPTPTWMSWPRRSCSSPRPSSTACRPSWTARRSEDPPMTENQTTPQGSVPSVVGVLGGGRMGAGIAHAFLTSGADEVIVVERDPQAAEAAKAGCPVSKALTGVEITLDAALES